MTINGMASRMAHLRIWKFRQPPGREREFATTYDGNGPWAALFARAEGFVGTELLRPNSDDGWWLTIDRWNREADFRAVQEGLGDEYRALDAELEGVAGEEEFVGAFEG